MSGWLSPLRRAITAHLEWIHRVTTRRPRPLLLAALLLFLLAAGAIATTRFEADIFKLFPARQGPLRLLLDSLEWTGSAREAYFLLEGESPAVLAKEAEAFAGRLREVRIDNRPAFRRIVYRVFDPAEAASFAAFIGFSAYRPQLFVPPDDLPKLLERLTPTGMDRALRRAASELASQAGLVSRDLITADPLGLRDFFLPRLQQGGQALDLDPTSPYFLSRDGKVLIMIAEPARPVQDMAFARQLVVGINAARSAASVRISCAGAHLSAVLDEAAMKRDIMACILSSLMVVLGIFLLTYRRLLPTLLLPAIICWGVVLALGVASLLLPTIHIISFAFMALIIGLGTDYSIHLYDRYHAERAAGQGAAEALRLATVDTGHGLFTAATTTALPFLALTLADVRALSELGLLVGLGVLFTLYATLFFLPPLLIYLDEKAPSRTYPPLPAFGLAQLWRLSQRRRWWVRLASLAACAGLLLAARGVGFEGELKNLQPRHSEAFLTQEKIERHLSVAPKQLLVALDGPDLGQLLARGNRVGALLERYRQQGAIVAFSSLGQLLNSHEDQQIVARRVATALADTDPAAWLRTALERNGFAPEAFPAALAGIARLAEGRSLAIGDGIAPLAASPLRGVVERHLVRDAAGYHLLLPVHYREEAFRTEAFLRELAEVDPAARVTGVDLVSRQLAESVRQSFLEGFILGGVLVLVLLLAHFRSGSGIFASLYPVLAGVVAMVGLMALTGMKFNFMNAMVLVTILGMGSDYGLHISHRVGSGGDPAAEFVQAGRAVLLSALTTIVGFGSLAFADYGALASIGWATNFGVGATALFALVSLPAFLPTNYGLGQSGG